MELLNGPCFFKNMLKDDPESEILHSIPKVSDLLQTYPLPITFPSMAVCSLQIGEASP